MMPQGNNQARRDLGRGVKHFELGLGCIGAVVQEDGGIGLHPDTDYNYIKPNGGVYRPVVHRSRV